MTSGQLTAVLRQLCRLVGASSVEELSDRQLLEAFAQHQDPGAFEILVQRHGPLVFGVCRRVLHEEHDAEDAFQATFMVLARKAGSIRRQEAVASWLCGTAYRIALKARAATGRRREQERQASEMSNTAVENDTTLWRELRPIIDEELNRLPAKYRVPLVLCYLQGKTNEAAARELGWAPGSMSYRLAIAKDKLRTRLMQRGVALSAAGLATLLAENASAAVQAPLIEATVVASVAYATGEATALAGISAKALGLADAGMQALRLMQLKMAAAVALAIVVVIGGVGVVAFTVRPPPRPGTGTAPPPTLRSTEPRIVVQFSESQRFGLYCPYLFDNGEPKKLTRELKGTTNNTCFRFDGRDYLFGIDVPGVRWGRDKNNKIQRGVKIAEHAWQSVIEIVDNNSNKVLLRVTQTVEIVRGEQTDLFDTLLVKYQLQNLDTAPHTVGLRFLLDTLIGHNDGVPFLIPPSEQSPARLMDSMEIFTKPNIPEFVRAIETDKLDDKKNTVAELNVKLQGYEPLQRLVICRWPDNSEVRWDWDFRPMNDPAPADSCVALYWADRTMKPNEKRDLAFTYGLGQIYGEGSGGTDPGGFGRDEDPRKLRLMTAGSSKVDRIFTATAYVKNDKWTGQKIKLDLPAGLVLAPGQKAEQDVPRAGQQGYSQVSWRIRSTGVGAYKLKVNVSGIKAEREVRITETSLFD